MKLKAFTLIFVSGFALLCACVSVNLGNHKAKPAVGVTYSAPVHPFASDTRSDVDAAWKNPKNGNLISYLSDCTDDSDPSLESIVNGSMSGLSELKTESLDSPTVQGREARRVLASGKVDGVASKIDLLVFKRNRCIFILGYVGVQGAFDQDHAQFDRFIAGFRAP